MGVARDVAMGVARDVAMGVARARITGWRRSATNPVHLKGFHETYGACSPSQRSQLARSPASPASPKQDTVREREQFIAQLEEAGQKVRCRGFMRCHVTVSLILQITALERQLRNTEDEKEDVMSEVCVCVCACVCVCSMCCA